MSKYHIEIAHPEWLEHSHPQKTIHLILAGKMPNVIAGWCLVVALKHPLRAVYGSDLRAAWKLLLWALHNRFEDKFLLPIERAWYKIPFVYAIAMTYCAGNYLKLRGQIPIWGRRESPEPVRCECGWAGMRRWAIHGYQDDGSGQDVEGRDECPRCGGEV